MGAVKSAVNRAGAGLAEQVAAIIRLPLTDGEKAEAIRALLAAK